SPSARLHIHQKRDLATDSALALSMTRAQSWESLSRIGLALLGPKSRFLGVCYGLAEGSWGLVSGLLDTLSMIVLEGLYQKVHGPLGASSWNPIDRVEARALDYVLQSHMETAHREFRQLMDELGRIVSHPLDFLGDAWNNERKEYSEKWTRYQWLLSH